MRKAKLKVLRKRYEEDELWDSSLPEIEAKAVERSKGMVIQLRIHYTASSAKRDSYAFLHPQDALRLISEIASAAKTVMAKMTTEPGER